LYSLIEPTTPSLLDRLDKGAGSLLVGAGDVEFVSSLDCTCGCRICGVSFFYNSCLQKK